MTRLLAWAAIVVLATYLTFIGGAWLGIYLAPLRVITILAAAATLGVWAIATMRFSAWRPRSVLIPAILAALGSLAISTIFSRVPRVSLEYLGYAVVLAALYLLLVRLAAHPFFGRRLLVLSGLFFVGVAVSFLGLVGFHWVQWWAELGHIAIPPLRPNFAGLTYLNPSAVLTMAVLLAVPLAALVDPGSRRGRVVLGLTVLILAVVSFLTGSRAGWLAIALTTLVAGAAVLLSPGRRSAIRLAARRVVATRRGAVIVAGFLVATVGGAAAFAPAILRRLSEGGEDLRAQYAVTAVRMFGESPIVGTGPGTWVIQRALQTAAGEGDYYIPHAHNLEVQTLAELGVVGAIAGVIVVVYLARVVVSAIRDQDPVRRQLGWATFLGLTYFGFHQLLDFYANMPAVLFAAVLPVAFLDASTPRPPTSTTSSTRLSANLRLPARLSGALAVIVVATALSGLLAQEVPATESTGAVASANGGHWAAADGPARAAADADPVIGSYALTAGLTAARANDHQAAATYFERVARSDDLPEAWLNLAAEQIELGDGTAARSSLDAAFRLGRQRPGIAIGIVDPALRIGATDLAVDALVDGLRVYPMLAGDPWWTANEERRATLDEATKRLSASATVDVAWQLALSLNQIERARSFATQTLKPTFNLLVIDAWLGNQSALAQLLATCDASPLDPNSLAWCARVAAHLGLDEVVERMRTLLEVLAPGLSNGAGLWRIATDPEPSARLVGGLATFWGTFTYRRATPVDMLVPNLAHLLME